jgi:argininosuccinate lyase
MSLLWQKEGVRVDERIQRFLAGDDIVHDRALFAHDLRASVAHAEGLAHIGILTADELEALKRELATLQAEFSEGVFVLDSRFEDGHSAIETRLVERLGPVGRKIHTGRSRNDQVLVATRLYLREVLATLQSQCKAIARVALDRAAADGALPLPGYTHLQRAMVSSAAMWWSAWAEAYIDDAQLAADTLRWVDANPLGSAAGYGVNIALDREHSTRALGFGRMQFAAT